MGITTRKGDQGETDLLLGQRISKTAPQMRALGAVDELNAALGLIRILNPNIDINRVQKNLMVIMGEISMPAGKNDQYLSAGFEKLSEREVAWLESEIFQLEKPGGLRGWQRPGESGSELSARLHVARTVTRRAELECWAIQTGVLSEHALVFLNRLSDWLWLLARETC